MRYEAPHTLAYYQAAPHFQKWAMANVLCADMVGQLAAYKAACSKVSPEQEAIQFYCMNHLASMIRTKYTPYETLPDWAVEIMESYLKVMGDQSKRVLYYMMLICVREARHLHTMPSTWWAAMGKKYGTEYPKFLQNMPGGETEAMTRLLNETPQMPVGRFYAAIAETFYKGKWSSSYGGKAWGQVTDPLVRFFAGETTMEVLLDTAYTLAHNTAPIFNKGMMYGGFNSHTIQKILDVQRAGMIPELVISQQLPTNPGLIATVKLVKDAIGGIEDAVDWNKVVALGAVGNYYKEVTTAPKPATPPKWLPKGGKVVGPWKVSPKEMVVQYKRAA